MYKSLESFKKIFNLASLQPVESRPVESKDKTQRLVICNSHTGAISLIKIEKLREIWSRNKPIAFFVSRNNQPDLFQMALDKLLKEPLSSSYKIVGALDSKSTITNRLEFLFLCELKIQVPQDYPVIRPDKVPPRIPNEESLETFEDPKSQNCSKRKRVLNNQSEPNKKANIITPTKALTQSHLVTSTIDLIEEDKNKPGDKLSTQEHEKVDQDPFENPFPCSEENLFDDDEFLNSITGEWTSVHL